MKILKGDPEELLPRLIRRVKLILQSLPVKAFRIGRSAVPYTRKIYYGFDKIVRLYKSEDEEDAQTVEHELIGYFQDFDPEKCENPVRDGGPFSSKRGNYVYIGLWFQKQ